MEIKIIGAVLVIASCSILGFMKSVRIRGRYRELLEWKKLLHLIGGEIRFGRNTLEEAFGSVAEKCEQPHRDFFFYLSDHIKKRTGTTMAEIWNAAVAETLFTSQLEPMDKEVLGSLGKELGCLDQETQLKTLQLTLEQLEDIRTELYKELPQKTKLYNSLGILAGIFLTILFI